MKKSAIVAFIILLVVVGWFFSGQLNSKKENLKKEPEKSEFNNVRDCGAVVETFRRPQLARVSGRSNTSNMGNRRLRRTNK